MIQLPFIRVELLEGRTEEVKRTLLKELSETAARVTNTPIDRVRVVLYEIPKKYWGIGGVPVSEIPGR